MHRIDIEQNSDLWFDFRRYKVGGSKVKGVKPLSRGKYKGLAEGAAGFWKLISERLSLPKDAEEDERARGHRLEAKAIELSNEKFGLELVKGKIWQSDENERLYISPDGEDPADTPVYAQETKAFHPDKHLRLIWEDLQAKKAEGYRPFTSIPDEYRDQVIHYFSINSELKQLYWTLICDTVAYEDMEHYSIIVDRDDVEGEIEKQQDIEQQVLRRTDQIVRELVDVFVKKEGK
jgi:hypothetical protein